MARSKHRTTRRKRASTSPMDYGQKQYGPVEELKEVAKERNMYARHTLWVKILMAFGIIAAVAACYFSLKTSNDFTALVNYTTRQANLNTSTKPGKEEAIRSVYAWASKENGSPFPNGITNLTWDGAVKIDVSTNTDTGETTERWSHQLSLTDLTDGSTRQVAQLISITNGIASPQGTPTILPNPISGSQGDTTAPKEYYTLAQTDSLLTTVKQWAKAYIGKDANALTVLVGDPNQNHEYATASIGTFQNANINWAVSLQKRSTSSTNEKMDTHPKYGAVSVTITFKPYPKATTSDEDQQTQDDTATQNVSTTMLLLVKNPASGSARIVDWGADGNVAALKAYANALDKGQVSAATEDNEDTDTDTGTGSEDSTESQNPDSNSGSDTGDSTSSDSSNSDTTDTNGDNTNPSENSDDAGDAGDAGVNSGFTGTDSTGD